MVFGGRVGKERLSPSSGRLGHSLCPRAGDGEGMGLAGLKPVGGEDLGHTLKCFSDGRWEVFGSPFPSTLPRC